MSSTNEEILHYQRKIVKYGSDAKVLLHCLGKLAKLPIGVQHLQDTGIGRTINGMRKSEGPVGEEARSLVNKWKEMVAAEDEKSESDHEPEQPASSTVDRVENVRPASSSNSKSSRESKSEHVKEEKTKASSSSKKKSVTRSKSPDKHSKSASRSDDRKRELKDVDISGSSSSKSSSKKRHHEESLSQGEDDDDYDDDDDAGEGLSFADALGSIDTTKSSSSHKKKKSKDKERHREEKRQKTAPTPVPVLPPLKAVAAPLDIRPLDFEISPHYKPLPSKLLPESPFLPAKGKIMSSEEALSVAMAQKGARTKVFSGNRSSGLSFMPTLFDFCIRVLQQNIDALEYTGGVPYDLLRPVLERATAHQLYALENYNPYLLDDTDELWKTLCQKEHRKAVREEMETWRDLYLRCHEEREARLKSLTSNHKSAMAKATPVRTTKLAFVESIAKAPRGTVKAQLKNGGSSAILDSMTKTKSGIRPFEAMANRGGDGGAAVAAEVVRMAPPPASRSGSSSATSSSSATANKKPKVAPLMQKTLKFIKNRYRR